jgi:hypothetical protein
MMGTLGAGSRRALLLALSCLVAFGTVRAAEAEVQRPVYGVAGVPVDLGRSRDYETIFRQLASSGVELFFPTFLYQQLPAPRSLGFERDFAPPCRPDDPAFRALRETGMGLIVPASLLYAPDRPLPSLDDDPMAALVDCAGEGVVRGFLTHDEPVHAGVPEAAVEALYARIKQVAPDIPVMMVHAPMTTDTSPQFHLEYIEAVRSMSRHADIVGFDVYPVPGMIAKIVRPRSGTEVLEDAEAVRAYADLMRELAPERRHLMVLQNFAYADQFSSMARTAFPSALVAAARGPTEAELEAMARAAEEGGAEVIVWFGGAYTPSALAGHWRATLDVTAGMTGR